MKQGIGPHNLGVSKRVEKMDAVPKMYKAAPTKQVKPGEPKKTDKGFYVTASEKPKGEMGSGFYIGGDGKRSHTPNSGGNSNVDPGFNIGAKKKAVKKVVKRKIATPVTGIKPKSIPRIVE